MNPANHTFGGAYLSRPYNGYSVNLRSGFVTESSYPPQIPLLLRLWALVRDHLASVRSYLSAMSNHEPNPYFQGRYLVALLICLSHSYEVAEAMFQRSRMARKIERWLESRCERFPYLAVRFDGSLGEWKEPQVMAPKKPVENVKAKKASAA